MEQEKEITEAERLRREFRENEHQELMEILTRHRQQFSNLIDSLEKNHENKQKGLTWQQ